MNESIVFSPDSLINLNTNIMKEHTGTATLSNGSLFLGAESSATFDYSFNTTDSIIQASNLRVVLDVINSNIDVNSRYDESVQVELYIQYYKELLDSNGILLGYELSGNDTYQINPYFIHEKEGYTNTYDINIDESMIAVLRVIYINTSLNDVEFRVPKLFNSMTIMDAITAYGGGSGGGDTDPDTPPLLDKLMLYSTSGDYIIDSTDGELTLEVFVPDEYIKEYGEHSSSDNYLYITWVVTDVSGNPKASFTEPNGYKRVLVDGAEYVVWHYSKQMKAYGDGVFNVRVELEANNTIYAERNITIINNNVVDMDLIVESENKMLHGTTLTNCTLKLIPETIKTGNTSTSDIRITVTSADGAGKAYVTNNIGTLVSDYEYNISGGVVNFVMCGSANGKVQVTAEIISDVNTQYTILYPVGFKKEFIVDVIGIPVELPVYIDASGGTTIDNTLTNLTLYVKSNDERLRYQYSATPYGIESLDGQGEAIAIGESGNYGTILTYSIYPIKPGKVKFWVKPETYTTNTKYYLEQEIEITGIKNELNIPIETNTGLFEITQGTGQLEIHPRPSYDWHGGFSFSQASIDGGSVTIEDKGNYALVTANKNGKLNLICTPVYGPKVQCEISISNQYPENVQLTCADNVFKVAVGGNLMVYAEPGNNPNATYDKYTWVGEKLDADVVYSSQVWDKYCKYTGTALGRFRLSAVRNIDNKLMASQVIKVVQSLDSDKTVLPYPDDKVYWVIWRKSTDSNKLYLATFSLATVPDDLKLVFNSSTGQLTCGVTLSSVVHYGINNTAWASKGSWSNQSNVTTSSCSAVYASNLDIYDENGNLLVAKTDNYDDVDLDKIIYG